MVAVILATGVAFLSEYKSDREFEVLNARKDSRPRQGPARRRRSHRSPLEEVVVGDLVLLEMGDEIPADGRLVKATELYIDQSLMTGESEPVRKQPRPTTTTADGPEQPGCVYRGTQVVDGVGADARHRSRRRHHARPDRPPAVRADRTRTSEREPRPIRDSRRRRVQHKLTISKA